MNCVSCGKSVSPNIRFCTGCGAPVGAAPVSQPTPVASVVEPATSAASLFKPKKVCSSCGSPLKPSSRFCNGCGAQVEAQGKVVSILTGILYVIFGVVGLLWNLISPNRDETQLNTPGWRFLTAAGLLYVILGALGILTSLWIFGKAEFESVRAFIVILNIWTLGIGIMGVKYRLYPAKAKLLQKLAVCAIVLLGILLFFVPIKNFSRLIIVISLISGIFDQSYFMFNTGFFIIFFLYIVDFAIPVFYLIGARKNLILA